MRGIGSEIDLHQGLPVPNKGNYSNTGASSVAPSLTALMGAVNPSLGEIGIGRIC